MSNANQTDLLERVERIERILWKLSGVLCTKKGRRRKFVPVMPTEPKRKEKKDQTITQFKSKFSLIDFQVEFLKNNGSQKATCEALKMSKATFFRLKKELDDAKSKTTSDDEEFK